MLQIRAQIQIFDFSGNSADSYQCFDNQGNVYLNGESGPAGAVEIYKDGVTGYYLCRGFDTDGVSGDDKAILRPPALQQLEIWFVRILYIIWALVGSFSFLLLVGVAYEYIIRGGTSDQELVKLRKRVINYIIGFALVFLAVPILTTVFRLLGINNDVACYNVAMPGFQFFFTGICTGNETYLRNYCEGSGVDWTEGLACPEIGASKTCSDYTSNPQSSKTNITFYCSIGTSEVSDKGVWLLIQGQY